MQAKLYDLTTGPKKYMIKIDDKKIKFGAAGYSDYTIHKDKDRRDRYIARHRARENWDKSGMYTAGFWSRWLLWNKPSIEESIRDIKKRFDIVIE